MYQAQTEADEDLAIKIYKTSILVFKDRKKCVPHALAKPPADRSSIVCPLAAACDTHTTALVARYVSGDWRFQRGYTASNPRKMVRVWAEKEMRNLARLHSAGIPCPKPHALRLHVLVMDFIGHEGVAAPRLHVRRSCVASDDSML